MQFLGQKNRKIFVIFSDCGDIMNMKRLLLSIALLMQVNGAHADISGYDKTLSLTTTSTKYQLSHFHSCRERPDHPSTWKELNPYLSRSICESGLKLSQIASQEVVFHIPSPLLTDILIDESQGLVIGLSNVKYMSPYQLLIVDFSGEVLVAARIQQSKIPCAIRESVTNYLAWYKADSTDLSVEVLWEGENIIGIKTQGLKGVMCEVIFDRDGVEVLDSEIISMEYQVAEAARKQNEELEKQILVLEKQMEAQRLRRNMILIPAVIIGLVLIAGLITLIVVVVKHRRSQHKSAGL